MNMRFKGSCRSTGITSVNPNQSHMCLTLFLNSTDFRAKLRGKSTFERADFQGKSMESISNIKFTHNVY